MLVRIAIAAVKSLKEQYGVVRHTYLKDSAKTFVLIFQDNPENWSVRWAIGEALGDFKWLRVVAQDGAWGTIDTTLPYTIPDELIKMDTAIFFLRRLLIHPAEYANVLRDEMPIHLFGVDDEELYQQAQKCYLNQAYFLRHQLSRAHVITDNLLAEMEKKGEPISALICAGDLPDLVSDELERRGVSHAIVQPKMSHPSDIKLYREILLGDAKKTLSYKDLLSEDPKILSPPKGQFPDKVMYDKKEQARQKLVALIASNELLSKMSLLPAKNLEAAMDILNDDGYGTKTKAVLIKAELISLLEKQKRQLAIAVFKYRLRNKLVMFAFFVSVVAIVGALIGAESNRLYQHGIVAAYAFTCIVSTVANRPIDALAFFLHIIAFLVGYYLWGRWGIIGGTIAVFLARAFLLPEQKIPPKEYRLMKFWKDVENLFC